MTLEYRTAIGGQFKDADESKRQVLVEFPHDVVDTYKTTFSADCFRESFAKRAPTMCWMHDMREPIGRAISAQVTDRANEMVGQLDPFDEVPLAKRAFSQIVSGTITDFSHGFQRQTDEPHPEHRGVTRITKAVMQEFSPVVLGAIPGAIVTGWRSENSPDNASLMVITMEDIERQFKDNLLDRHEARAMLAALSPEYRLHVVLGGTTSTPVVEVTTTDPTVPVVVAGEPGEARDASMASAVVPVAQASGGGDDDDDAASLAAATDAALDSAVYWLSKVDVSSLPPEAQQAIALVQAAGATVDELLDVMGVFDADDPDEMEGGGDDSGRSDSASEVASDAEVSAAEAREDAEAEVEARALSTKPWDPKPADYTLAQWKAACLIWDGPDDQVGSGSLPVLEPDGSPNKAGMAAAAGRLNQVKASDADKKAAAKKLLGLYGSNKLKAPGSLLQAARSVDDPETRILVTEAVDSELDDLFGRLGVEAA